MDSATTQKIRLEAGSYGQTENVVEQKKRTKKLQDDNKH
jgi:hypothetical protein